MIALAETSQGETAILYSFASGKEFKFLYKRKTYIKPTMLKISKMHMKTQS